ncbi:MAG: HAMP domain-containing sensor histidine kinase [Bacteroidota bacterium]
MLSNIELDVSPDPTETIYLLAHDIKSPINRIKGLLEIAKSSTCPNEIQNILEMALYSSENLRSKVDTLLNKAVNGHQEPHEFIDFERIVEDIRESLSAVESMNDAKIIVRVENDLNYYSSPVLHYSILHNLIENALKYRRPTADSVVVIVSISRSGDGLSLTVSDNGSGMDAETTSKIFNKSYRADTTHHGHGLGLFLVQKNVAKLGGTIEVESQVDTGSTFTIVLPYCTC